MSDYDKDKCEVVYEGGIICGGRDVLAPDRTYIGKLIRVYENRNKLICADVAMAGGFVHILVLDVPCAE